MSVISYLVSGFSYKCTLCSSLMLCDRFVIQNHMTTKHQKKLSFTTFSENRLQYQKLCDDFMKGLPVSAHVHENKIVPVEKVPITEISSTIGNLCTYFCPYCDTNNLSSWVIFKHHVRTVHFKKEAFRPSIVQTARYHSCLICPKAMLNDRGILVFHLMKKHKMSLGKYEKIFSKHGGKVLPTYKKWLREILNKN